MNLRSRHWLWLLLIVPVAAGLVRLRFDVDVLDLLPENVQAVQGLKLYQKYFANAQELLITVQTDSPERSENVAREIAEALRAQTNLVAQATWQPPWLEHPDQAAELLAYIWLNQPPEVFSELTNRLSIVNASAALSTAREQLATSLSPDQIARLSYDPFGLTQLPGNAAAAAPRFGQGQEMFASEDGTFRVVFVQAKGTLANYRECADWLDAIQKLVNPIVYSRSGPVKLGFTGAPAFVAETSSGMQHDMTISVGGTSVLIALLFWLAHRRVKPMLWLLTLLALVLLGTLGLGGLFLGTINVVSMGFAAILLGLAVDYAVVHYQEALAHPDLSVPEIRHAIAPSIFWAAVTTITAFLVLNFGGLPGLGQLGSLVGMGIALSACVMIFGFLPPLFPNRRKPGISGVHSAPHGNPRPLSPARSCITLVVTCVVLIGCLLVLSFGPPRMDSTATALRPRNSSSYSALEEVQKHLGGKDEPLWVLVSGQNEADVARDLDALQAALDRAKSNEVFRDATLPTVLWPRPEYQARNRVVAEQLATRRETLHMAAQTNGFAESSLVLTDSMLQTWLKAAATTSVFWPSNDVSGWIIGKLAARSPTNCVALGLLHPQTSNPVLLNHEISNLESRLSTQDVWISGWQLLGNAVFATVKKNMWKLLAPMIFLVLLSLWLAFRRPLEIFLSLSTLAMSGLCLLAIMRFTGWSWNLLNLMGIPLILGTGVDYSIFMQLALRRYDGDLHMTYRSVGRALLLCGATAIAGFGSLAWSSNAGMSSLGQVCAVGIAGNMLISIFLLPVWWRTLARGKIGINEATPISAPSSLYQEKIWRLGLRIVRILPRNLCIGLSGIFVNVYWLLALHRRELVIQNLLPALNNDRSSATKKARALFHQFGLKLVDLWRYEAGLQIENLFGNSTGWEHFANAQAEGRGVLLLTPHLGNWEFGGPWLTQKGVRLQVITQAEPGETFTELRRASRARWNIETLVIRDDPFAFLEIIRRLEAGAMVALLVDRPLPATAVTVNLFGQPFPASIAAAELARASGCVLLPVYIPRAGDVYEAHVLPPIVYDRAALRDRNARQQLTQKIITAFEPAVCKYLDQWFHFVPIWPAK